MLGSLLQNTVLTLFTIVVGGLLLGRLRVAGMSLGSSGVIFVALIFGHLGYKIPAVGTLGLVLFVYCVGLSAGPSFFRELLDRGTKLAKLSLIIVGSGTLTAWVAAKLGGLPADLAAGILAGALTSTPALAAALESLPPNSQAAVGYGVAYLFGVVGVVIFVQLLPRLLRQDLDRLGHAADDDDSHSIIRILVEVLNPAVDGKTLPEIEFIGESNCRVSRVLVGKRLVPIKANHRLAVGQHVLLIGGQHVSTVVDLLGKRSDCTDYVVDTQNQLRHIVVSSRNLIGKALGELRLLSRFGVTVSRITRHDLEFVPKLTDVVRYGDALTVVGEPENLDKLATHAGHRARSFDETDIISLGAGIIGGILLGTLVFELRGSRLSLGMAGGPLLVALVLGHFGQIGPVSGTVPRASRLLMSEIGLVFFLASAGVNAGKELWPVLRQHGLALFGTGCLVTSIPMAVGYLSATYLFKMDLLATLGGICGGLTSTPGLGAIASKTDSEVPVVSYAAAYPISLIMVTALARVLVSVLD